MRVLITNARLTQRSGTEIFVEQLTRIFRARGHEVAVYSPLVGDLGSQLISSGVLVYDRVENIAFSPDLIHGHHNGPAMTALARFPQVPTVFVSHSVEAEFDRPPLHPSIVRYYAVSDFVRRRWSCAALPADRIAILNNAVDLDAAGPSRDLPDRPRTAALVCKSGQSLELIRQVCDTSGLSLEEYGAGARNISPNLAEVFSRADIVFASGRSALEAMAGGCFVVLTESGRIFGAVRSSDIDDLMRLNLGLSTLRHDLTRARLEKAVDAYSPADGKIASERVRRDYSLSAQADRLIADYNEAIRTFDVHDTETASRAIAHHMEAYTPGFRTDRWLDLALIAPAYRQAFASTPSLGQGRRLLDEPEPFLAVAQRPRGRCDVGDLAYLFRLVLGRSPTEEEWIERLSTSLGQPLDDVVADFLGTPEFRRRRRKLKIKIEQAGKQA